MRKLAPAFLMTSMLAFAGGALANTTATDKATGSPTVDANKSTGQDLSYSDKSNTSPGTNAKLDKTKKNKKTAKAHTTKDTVSSDTTAATDTSASTSMTPAATSPAPMPAPTAGSKAAATNSTTGQSPQ